MSPGCTKQGWRDPWMTPPWTAPERNAGASRRDTPVQRAEVERVAPCRLRLTLHEGRYHQVRRMLAAVGSHVETLHRCRMGPHARRTLRRCVAGIEPDEVTPCGERRGRQPTVNAGPWMQPTSARRTGRRTRRPGGRFPCRGVGRRAPHSRRPGGATRRGTAPAAASGRWVGYALAALPPGTRPVVAGAAVRRASRCRRPPRGPPAGPLLLDEDVGVASPGRHGTVPVDTPGPEPAALCRGSPAGDRVPWHGACRSARPAHRVAASPCAPARVAGAGARPDAPIHGASAGSIGSSPPSGWPTVPASGPHPGRCEPAYRPRHPPLGPALRRRGVLDRARPGRVVLIESALWPGWIAACRRRGIPITIVYGKDAARHDGNDWAPCGGGSAGAWHDLQTDTGDLKAKPLPSPDLPSTAPSSSALPPGGRRGAPARSLEASARPAPAARLAPRHEGRFDEAHAVLVHDDYGAPTLEGSPLDGDIILLDNIGELAGVIEGGAVLVGTIHPSADTARPRRRRCAGLRRTHTMPTLRHGPTRSHHAGTDTPEALAEALVAALALGTVEPRADTGRAQAVPRAACPAAREEGPEAVVGRWFPWCTHSHVVVPRTGAASRRPVPVISVGGSLRAGGKTPVAAWLAAQLPDTWVVGVSYRRPGGGKDKDRPSRHRARNHRANWKARRRASVRVLPIARAAPHAKPSATGRPRRFQHRNSTAIDIV